MKNDMDKALITERKNDIRKRVLEARKTVSPVQISIMSGAICDRLLKLDEYAAADVIMCYMDFRNEVQTGRIITETLLMGKKVALPVMRDHYGTRKLDVHLVKDLKNDMLTCRYGILEPNPETTERLDTSDISLVLVPGVAFGLDKNRVGYGAGYYDRFLAELNAGVPKIGLAFEFQITGHIPADENDITMDMIVTENRIIR